MELIVEHIRTLFTILRLYRLSKKAIVSFQDRRVRKIVDYAYRKVPYYRSLFDKHGITPAQIKGLEDLERIPISSREDYMGEPLGQMISKDKKAVRLKKIRTSGSAGKPLTIAYSRMEGLLLSLMGIRIRHYYGKRMWDNGAIVTYVRRSSEATEPLLKRIAGTVGLYRSKIVDCSRQPDEIYHSLVKYRPLWLGGYAGSIAFVADWMLERGLKPWKVKAVSVGGEVLTDKMRERITRAFNAPVFQGYGSHEFDIIAWQCKEADLFHVMETNVIVEVIKEDGSDALPGEEGEMVGTSLSRFSMPFIRYRLGDIVTWGGETCSCGGAYGTIRKVQGRKIDTFILPDGRSFHPYRISETFVYTADWVRQYSLVQEKPDRIVLYVVPFYHPPLEERERIRQEARALLGAEIDFQIVFVAEIERGPGGKFHVSRSLVTRARACKNLCLYFQDPATSRFSCIV
jgi:phenylacetate-CoA ligase